jgi:Ion channel
VTLKRHDPPHKPFRERVQEGDTYGLLLILIIVAYFLLAFVGKSHWGKVVLAIAFAGVLLLTLHTSHVRGRWMRVTMVLAAITISTNVVQAIVDNEGVTGMSYLWIGFLIASPIVILSRILRHPSVDLETILGAICAYLLIGIAFGALYGMLQTVGSENFFAQPGPYERIDFLYFSFIVLTTTGFGDLTPYTSVGKVIVTLEALIGQVFLVTIVASLVASFGFRRAAPIGKATADDDAPGTPE